MARTPRQDPFTQGVIADIYKWFIGPLLKYKPEAVTLKEWMEYLFHYAERDVLRYVARKHFRLPGLLYLAPAVKVQGVGTRRVKPGQVFWVRRDASAPEFVDVEYQGGHGRPDQIFCLSLQEWEWMEMHLIIAEKEYLTPRQWKIVSKHLRKAGREKRKRIRKK